MRSISSYQLKRVSRDKPSSREGFFLVGGGAVTVFMNNLAKEFFVACKAQEI
jgi:hypothetical protein